MKAMICLSFSAVFLAASPTLASESLADLQRRCSEQERQIERLELENSRLRSVQLAPATQTKAAPKEESPSKPAASAPAPKAESLHIVKKGETLSGIAKAHGIKTSQLTELNQLKNSGIIQIGQRLKLPVSEPTEAIASAAPSSSTEVRGTHKVKQGETFYSIAKTYGLSVDSLSSANPDINPKALRVGQELQLVARRSESPSPEPTQAPSPQLDEEPTGLVGSQTIINKRPTVRRVPITEQITLQQFADQYSMDIARLKRLNGLSDERYRSNTILAEGSALFVSAQPLD